MISVERFCKFKNRNSPDLEENLRAHAEETVDDPERKHHGHAVDEPRDGLESECRLGPSWWLDAHKLKNHGSDATDSCTSTAEK